MSIESQFEEFEKDDVQSFDIEVQPEERTAALLGLKRVVEEIAVNPEMSLAIASVLAAVSRTYEPTLAAPRKGMSVEQRNDEDQVTRGIIIGLARARDYLTTTRYAGELLKRLQPDQED